MTSPRLLSRSNSIAPHTSGELPRALGWTHWLTGSLFFAYLAYLLSRPFRTDLFWMEYMTDDFYYYLKIAQNISLGHGSTFQGTVQTNGYHPLFEGLVVLLAPAMRVPTHVVACQAILIAIASVAVFLLSAHLLQRTGAHMALVLLPTIWITLYSLRLFYYGMETTLAVPLALATLAVTLHVEWWLQGGWHALALGLLASATIFARLDCAFLIALMVLCCAAQPGLRTLVRWPTALMIGLGLLPVVLYIVSNHYSFGVWLPISGLAKELKSSFLPSIATWQELYRFLPGFLTVVLPIPLAVVLLPWSWRLLSPVERGVLLAALCFPPVYYFVLSCLSDWTIWGWYLYPFRVALLASFYVLCKLPSIRALLGRPLVRVALLAIVSLFLLRSRWRHAHELEFYVASRELAAFAENHRGTYAMGDRAGGFGYLTSNPVVQTEGLVMDKTFLEDIRQQRPLREVLSAYGVRYYVGTVFPSNAAALTADGCFHAVEPLQAGPDSPKMRGTFCGPPVLRLEHDGITNLVYDLANQTATIR